MMKHYFYLHLLLIIFINFECSYACHHNDDDHDDHHDDNHDDHHNDHHDDDHDDHHDDDHGDHGQDHYDHCGWKYGCFGYPSNCVDYKSCSILVTFTQDKHSGDVNFHLTSSEMDNRYL